MKMKSNNDNKMTNNRLTPY